MFDTIKVLTFDCYGTLIDWERGLLERLRPWVHATRPELSDNEILEAYAQAESQAERYCPTMRYPNVLWRAYWDLAQRFALPGTNAEAQQLAQSVGDWPAFEDSPAALARLQERFKLVILSNVDRKSFARTQARLGITFDAVITAEDTGTYKPDRLHFQRGIVQARQWGFTQDQMLHVAQSLYHDMVPAKSLDLKTVWVNRRHDQPGWGATPAADVTPDLEVYSMAELADRLCPILLS